MSAVRDAIRRLESQGHDPVTASNLTAYALGLHPTRSGWTTFELEHLVALRWEREHPKPKEPVR